jgi:hypothetical protein
LSSRRCRRAALHLHTAGLARAEILRQLRNRRGVHRRPALSAIAWRHAQGVVAGVEDTERFTFGQAFKAYVTGDAVGNAALGPLASEGTKALLIRRNIVTSAAFSSVVLRIFSTASASRS